MEFHMVILSALAAWVEHPACKKYCESSPQRSRWHSSHFDGRFPCKRGLSSSPEMRTFGIKWISVVADTQPAVLKHWKKPNTLTVTSCRLSSCMFTSRVLSVVEQQHRQQREVTAEHPPAGSVDRRWQCGTLFVVFHMDTCPLSRGRTLLWQNVHWPWLVWKQFIGGCWQHGRSNPGCTTSDDLFLSYLHPNGRGVAAFTPALQCLHQSRTFANQGELRKWQLLLGQNVDWPHHMLPPGDSQWVYQRDRHTDNGRRDGRMPDINNYAFR